MTNAKRVNEILNEVAPYELAENWDNCGLLVDCGGDTDKILFALDVTGDSVKKAKELGCGMIVSHHPAIFGGGWYAEDRLDCGRPHLTCHVLSAMACLGGTAEKELRFVRPWRDPDRTGPSRHVQQASLLYP